MMINYIEKGIGLHKTIHAAGFAFRQENGEWVAEDHATQKARLKYERLKEKGEKALAEIGAIPSDIMAETAAAFLDHAIKSDASEVAVQAIIDAYTPEDAAAAVGDDIDAYARTLRARILKDTDPSEMAAWATKYAEAKALQASGKPSDAPNLVAEAAFRGTTLTVLATKVIQKYNQTGNREARIAGLAGKHKDIIANLGSFDAINAYDWRTPMAGA